MTDARAFRGFRFPAEVILWAVRWYLQFPLSYRDLERMLAERGAEVDHTTMHRWVQRFAPELEKRLRRHLRPCRRPWHVDETLYLIAASGRSRGMRPGQPERDVRPRVCDVDGAPGLATAPSPGSDGVWAVGVPRAQNVYPTGVELPWPTAATGRPREHPVPSEEPVPAEQALAGAEWRRISWRRGTKGPLAAEFAALRVRPAEGEQLRDGRHLPRDEAWLLGERRASGERKDYLSNLPPGTPLEELAATIKARWICEQAHQQLKGELGLGHFEGRSWTGLHRHALPAGDARLLLPPAPPAQGAGEKRRRRHAGTTAAAEPARGPAMADRAAPRPPRPLPLLRG